MGATGEAEAEAEEAGFMGARGWGMAGARRAFAVHDTRRIETRYSRRAICGDYFRRVVARGRAFLATGGLRLASRGGAASVGRK
jgi:hypothetical protein